MRQACRSPNRRDHLVAVPLEPTVNTLRRLVGLLVVTTTVLVGTAGAALANLEPPDPAANPSPRIAPLVGGPGSSSVASSGMSGWALAALVLLAVIVGVAFAEIAHGVARHRHHVAPAA